MKIVADTNVLISMLLWGKTLEQLFILINQRKITLCFSPETIDELFRVIRYPEISAQAEKMKINPEPLIDKLLAASIICYPKSKINIILEDPSDNKILEAASEAKVQFIVSGDKYLLKLKTFEKISIITPTNFLQLFKP